jgi:hypothetical protein
MLHIRLCAGNGGQKPGRATIVITKDDGSRIGS